MAQLNVIKEEAKKYAKDVMLNLSRNLLNYNRYAEVDFVSGGEYVDSLLRPVIENMEKEVMLLNSKNVLNLNALRNMIYKQNLKLGWWTAKDLDLEGKDRVTLIASKLALVHSEISEALEGVRKNLNDDHLPKRPMIEVELADAIIRVLDLCGFMGLDIDGAVSEKINYNKNRQDHKLENRNAEGGKVK